MNTQVFALMYMVGMIGLTILQGYLSYVGKAFFARQMRRKYENFLPFTWHFGASYGDMLIVTPVTTCMIWKYGSQWQEKTLAVFCAITTSIIFHRLWSRDKTPGCLIRKQRLTAAGYVHVIYMGLSLIPILSFYFQTTTTDASFVVTVSSLLGLHVFIGSHMLLSIINPIGWKSNLRDYQSWIIVTCCWLALVVRSYQMINK